MNLNKARAVLLLVFAPLTVKAQGYSGYFLVDSFSYSEPFAIRALATGDWDTEFHGGEKIFSTDRIEFGIAGNKWQLGILRRYDYFYEFTPDTAYLKHSAENHLDLVPGQELELYLKANEFIANGITLGFAEIVGKASFGIRVSYLKGEQLTSGSLSGSASVINEKDYDLNFDVDYYYSEDLLFDREVAAPDGNGFAIDLDIGWQAGNWDFMLDIKDLLARIYWQDAPRTVASGNSNTVNYDANGYLAFNPAVSGLETNQDYTQTLPRKIDFTTTWQLDDYAMLFEVQDFEIMRFYSLGAGFDTGYNDRINILYNVTAQALKFDYHNKWFGFSITSDELLPYDARTFALTLSISMQY